MCSGDSTAIGMKPMIASLFRRHAVTAALMLAVVPALPALAHPKLVSATPAAAGVTVTLSSSITTRPTSVPLPGSHEVAPAQSSHVTGVELRLSVQPNTGKLVPAIGVSL